MDKRTLTFRGLSSAAAAEGLSTAVRGVLERDRARIAIEARHDFADILLRHGLTVHHVVMLLCACALVASFVYGADTGGRAASRPSVIVTAAAVVLNVVLDVALVWCRSRRLRNEVHEQVWQALLEFERAMGVFAKPHPGASPPRSGSSAAAAAPEDGAPADHELPVKEPTVTTSDGIVTRVDGPWELLGLVDHGRQVHSFLVFRDRKWMRMPVSLLVKGDLIALMSHETAPCKVRGVDRVMMGRRSSHKAVWNLPGIAARSGDAGEPHAAQDRPQRQAGTTVDALPEDVRDRDVAALTLCSDLRRFVLQDTPIIASLNKRLRQPNRPQPLLMMQLRACERALQLLQMGAAVTAVIGVVVRSVVTGSVPDASLPVTRSLLSGSYVGLVAGLLEQLPAVLLAAAPMTIPLFLVCAEALGTAHMLAVHEAAAVRAKWKEWRRSIILDRVHADQAAAAARQLAATNCSQDVSAQVDELDTLDTTRDSETVASTQRWQPLQGFQAVLSRAFRRQPSIDVADSATPAGYSVGDAPPEGDSTHPDVDAAGTALLSGSARADVAASQFIVEGDAVDAPASMEEGAGAPQGDGALVASPRTEIELAAAAKLDPDGASPDANRGSVPDTPRIMSAREVSSRLWMQAYAATRLVTASRRWLRSRHALSPRQLAEMESAMEDGRTESHFPGDDGESVRTRLTLNFGGGERVSRLRSRMPHDIPRRLPAAVLVERERERILRTTRRVRQDVGDVDARFECVPEQYCAPAPAHASNRFTRFIHEGGASSSALPETQLANGKEDHRDVSATASTATCCTRAWSLCPRRRGMQPIRRVFNGPTFSQISSPDWRAVSCARLSFYLLRFLRQWWGFSPPRSHHAHASNPVLNDDLIDVGFGLRPMTTPLLGHQLVVRLGASNVFCAADRNSVTLSEPVVENVMVLKGESASAIIDLHADDASVTGVRFDDKHWLQHLSSLKPVGLACLVGARDDVAVQAVEVQQEKAHIEPAAASKLAPASEGKPLDVIAEEADGRTSKDVDVSPPPPSACTLRKPAPAVLGSDEPPSAPHDANTSVAAPANASTGDSEPHVMPAAAHETIDLTDVAVPAAIQDGSTATQRDSEVASSSSQPLVQSTDGDSRQQRLSAPLGILTKWRQSLRASATPVPDRADISIAPPAPADAIGSGVAKAEIADTTSPAAAAVAPPKIKGRSSTLRSLFRRDSSTSASRRELDTTDEVASPAGGLSLIRILAPLTQRRRDSVSTPAGTSQKPEPADNEAEDSESRTESEYSYDSSESSSDDGTSEEGESEDESDSADTSADDDERSASRRRPRRKASMREDDSYSDGDEDADTDQEDDNDDEEEQPQRGRRVHWDVPTKRRRRRSRRARRRDTRRGSADADAESAAPASTGAEAAPENPSLAEAIAVTGPSRADVEPVLPAAVSVPAVDAASAAASPRTPLPRLKSVPSLPADAVPSPFADSSLPALPPALQPRRSSIAVSPAYATPLHGRTEVDFLHSALAGDLQIPASRHRFLQARRSSSVTESDMRHVHSSSDLQGTLAASRNEAAGNSIGDPDLGNDSVTIVVSGTPEVVKDDEFLVLAPSLDDMTGPATLRSDDVALPIDSSTAMRVSGATVLRVTSPVSPPSLSDIHAATTALFEHAAADGARGTVMSDAHVRIDTERKSAAKPHRSGRKPAASLRSSGAAARGELRVTNRVDVTKHVGENLGQIKRDDYECLHALAQTIMLVPPRTWLVPLAREMGFTDHDEAYFQHVRHVHTLVGTERTVRTHERRRHDFIAASSSSQAMQHGPGLRRVYLPRNRREPWLNPAFTATVVRDLRTQRMQMLSQGNLPFLLANCSDYWDGDTLWPLNKQRRNALLAMYQQWRAEDLLCVGLAYDPVSNQEVALFNGLDATQATLGDRSRSSADSGGIGLHSDRAKIMLVTPEGGKTLNAQADARKMQSEASASGLGAVPPSMQHGSAWAARSSLEERLWRMQSGQVFVGMVAARHQPRPKMQNVIKDLTTAGVRFVYMAQRNYRRVRPLAQKMGLETDWNCAISLLPRRKQHTAQDAALAAAKLPGKNVLGQYEVDEDDEDFGVQGVISDEKRWRLLRSGVDEQVWDMKAQLPHGVPEIRTHLQERDNVPLLVSLFTDSTPPASAGMLRIMQENGEQVLVVASALRKSSFLLFTVADVAIALAQVDRVHKAHHIMLPLPPPPLRLSQWVLSGSPAGYPGRHALPLELTHPGMRFATSIAAMHCAFTLPTDRGLGIILKVLGDSKRWIAALKQTLALTALVQAALALHALLTILTAMPQALPVQHIMWLLWVILPCVTLPMLVAPPEPGLIGEDRTPEKRAALGQPLWDILPGPSAPSSDNGPLPDVPVAEAAQAETHPVDVTNEIVVQSDGVAASGASAAALQDAQLADATAEHPISSSMQSLSGLGITTSVRGPASTPLSDAEETLVASDDVAVHIAAADDQQLDANDEDIVQERLAVDEHEAPLVFSDEPEGDMEVALPQLTDGLHDGSTPMPDMLHANGSPTGAGIDANHLTSFESAASPSAAPHGGAALSATPARDGPTTAGDVTSIAVPHVEDTPAGGSTFNPVTGGVRAESLIKYGAYHDVASTLAGHVVEVSAASSRTIRNLIRANAEKPAAPAGPKAANRTAAEKDADPVYQFTKDIQPTQGSLAHPPPAPIPSGFGLYCGLMLALATPAALFHEYLHARVIAASVMAQLEAGRYPLIVPPTQPSAGGSSAPAKDPTVVAAMGWSQGLVLFSWVLWVVFTSAHFVYRAHPVWRVSPLRARAWLCGCVIAIAAQFVYSHLCATTAGAPSVFSHSMPADVWGSVAAFQVLSFAWTAVLKASDARVFERVRASLRAYFDTRLGMYSPR